MAFLMLLHEKMRLKRECNKLTLRQLQMSHRKERISKNIKTIQNMYAKKETMIDSQANMFKAQFKNSIFNQAGLGADNQMFSPYGNMNGMGGITTFVMNAMSAMVANGINVTKADGTTVSLDNDKYQAIMTAYMSGSLKPIYAEYDENGNPKSGAQITGYGPDKDNETCTSDEYSLFQQALRNAEMQRSQAQAYCQQADQNYQQNINIWVEAQKAQIEEEQSAALAPLELLETEYDLEAELAETELETKKARLKSVEEALKQEIQDGAPKFGLG